MRSVRKRMPLGVIRVTLAWLLSSHVRSVATPASPTRAGASRPNASEIQIDDLAVVATRQPVQDLDVAALAEEADRAVAEAEESAARVPAAERLRGRAVDPGTVRVHPPHHVADPDGAVSQPRHPGPEGGPL